MSLERDSPSALFLAKRKSTQTSRGKSAFPLKTIQEPHNIISPQTSSVWGNWRERVRDLHLSCASWHLRVESCVGWQIAWRERPTPHVHYRCLWNILHGGAWGHSRLVLVPISRWSTGTSACGSRGWALCHASRYLFPNSQESELALTTRATNVNLERAATMCFAWVSHRGGQQPCLSHHPVPRICPSGTQEAPN